MAIEAPEIPATTAAPQRVLLRVKRPYTQPPIEFFNAVHSKRGPDPRHLKRAHQQLGSSVNESALHPEKRTCFRYLGTADSLESSATTSSSDLEVMGASGERRLVWAASAKAHVIDPVAPRTRIPCTVQVSSTTPSVAQKRKADPNHVDTGTDSHPSPPHSPSPKSLRVIDLLYPDSSTSDPLAMTLNGLRLSATKAPPLVNVDPPTCGFVYDVYVSEPDYGDREGENGEVFNLERDTALVMEDSDDARTWGGDSDDSNSESNWRNDYPDEEERFGAGDDDDDDELDEYGKSDDSDAESGDDEFGIYRHRTAYYSDLYL